MKLISPSNTETGTYFRPGDYEDAVALIVEPLRVTGRGGDKEISCRVEVYWDEDAIDDDTPEVIPDARIKAGALYRQAKAALDSQASIACCIDRGDPTWHDTRPWLFADLEADLIADLDFVRRQRRQGSAA